MRIHEQTKAVRTMIDRLDRQAWAMMRSQDIERGTNSDYHRTDQAITLLHRRLNNLLGLK